MLPSGEKATLFGFTSRGRNSRAVSAFHASDRLDLVEPFSSPLVTSGSLPMSSAEIASTMEVESRLTEIALSMPRRMPVTTTVSSSVASVAGGDDYELLFAVPPRRRSRLRSVLREARGLAVTRIGELTAGRDVELVRNGSAGPLPSGFTHF